MGERIWKAGDGSTAPVMVNTMVIGGTVEIKFVIFEVLHKLLTVWSVACCESRQTVLLASC